jgi:hypothetical protein
MDIARNAQKLGSVLITPCEFVMFAKKLMSIVGSYGGIAMLAKKTSVYMLPHT